MKKHLRSIIIEIGEATKNIKESNNYISGVWYQVIDVPLPELREVAKEYGVEIDFNKESSQMYLQLSFAFPDTTIFCYSKKSKSERAFGN